MSNIKKLTTEEKAALSKVIIGEDAIKLMAAIKAEGEGGGTFEVIFTSGVVDRHGETVNPDGWSFENYMTNPVVLFAHDYSSLPVGAVDDIRRDGGKWIAKGRFAPADANPFAANVRALYEAGFLKTVSVGFMPLELDANFNSIKQELLEISFVPVPANPEALSLAKEKGLDLDAFKAKGLVVEDATTEKSKLEEAIKALEAEKVTLTASCLALTEENTDLKAGRSLSEKNRTLIRDCADGLRSSMIPMEKVASALEDLLNSTEPATGDDDETEKTAKIADAARIQRLMRLADKTLEEGLRLIGRNMGK